MSQQKLSYSARFGLTAVLAVIGFCILLAPSLGQAEVVRIGGTGSGLGTIKALAEAFQKTNPEFQYEIVANLGSAGGIKAVTKGVIQIGLSNRRPKPAEAVSDLLAFEFARTPFIFISTKPELKGLNLAELTEIYAGRNRQWPDGSPIRMVLREIDDSDNAVLAAMSAEMKGALVEAHQRKGMTLALSDHEAVDFMGRVKGGFGTSTLALVRSESRQVNILAINGVSPTVANLANGSYPYFKPLYLISHQAQTSALLAKFIAFVRSPTGGNLLMQLGNVPTPA